MVGALHLHRNFRQPDYRLTPVGQELLPAHKGCVARHGKIRWHHQRATSKRRHVRGKCSKLALVSRTIATERNASASQAQLTRDIQTPASKLGFAGSECGKGALELLEDPGQKQTTSFFATASFTKQSSISLQEFARHVSPTTCAGRVLCCLQPTACPAHILRWLQWQP